MIFKCSKCGSMWLGHAGLYEEFKLQGISEIDAQQKLAKWPISCPVCDIDLDTEVDK